MKITQVALCLSGLLWALSCTSDLIDVGTVNESVASDSATAPNILLVIADDMGLDASPGYNVGSTKPTMPNLQRMIDEGVTFNNAWSNPTCTPTRGTILTGKYGFRTGVTQVGDVMLTSETSLQRYLDDNAPSSYAHAVIGKWHLSQSATHPTDMGVGYYAGLLRGAVSSYYNWDLTINGNTETTTEYTTTKLTDLAIDWVADQSEPWFLWLAYNAPHTPFHLPPDGLHTQGALPSDQASIDANPLPYYLAALEAMDTEMGRLLASMSEEERENTVVIFIGDNGTPQRVVQDYGRLRAKETIYQGGINVPLVVSGKDVTRATTTEDALITTTDLFATIAEIAGADITEINDSQSFKHLLTDGSGTNREYAYTELGVGSDGTEYTIRNSTHKYLQFSDGTEALYNLVDDPLEAVNLLDPALSDSDTSVRDELLAALADIRG